MTDDKSSTASVPGWPLVPRFLLWLGSSTGAIGVLLSTFGFLVEHAYFDRLGIPRTLYQATPHEYLVTGGKFLLGIVPLALAGLLQFCLNYWLLALATALLVALFWWRGWLSNARWLAAAICLVIALVVVARRFKSDGPPDYAGVAMFTFVVVAAIAFAYVEVFFTSGDAPRVQSISRYACRIPFAVTLISALVALPYLRGYYALERQYPVVQFLAKDQTYFCSLSGHQPPPESRSCEQETWQIIDMGADRAIVRRVLDSRIYVVPAASVTAFRILGKEQSR
jgi:hypothetical protein